MKKSLKAKKTTPHESAEPQFVVSLQLDKTQINGTGESVLDALRALPKPVKITTKSVLTVQRGEKKHSRPLTIPHAQKLFMKGHQINQAKNLELLLK